MNRDWNLLRFCNFNPFLHLFQSWKLKKLFFRGAEPKQLAFSAALGITLGVFPICGMLYLTHLDLHPQLWWNPFLVQLSRALLNIIFITLVVVNSIFTLRTEIFILDTCRLDRILFGILHSYLATLQISIDFHADLKYNTTCHNSGDLSPIVLGEMKSPINYG